jgi:hypothetical protein
MYAGNVESLRIVHKKSLWWNNEIKFLVKKKKDLFKCWIKSKKEDDYHNYKIARKEINRKKKEKKIKNETWQHRFGKSLTKDEKIISKKLFKRKKNIRTKDAIFN